MINPMINSQNEVDVSLWEADLVRALNLVWQQLPIADFPELVDVEPLVTLEFVTPEDMRNINAETRGVDAVTDVLSFPMLHIYEGVLQEPLSPGDVHPDETGRSILELGDIVICPVRVLEQAAEYGHSSRREAVFLTVHGMLHLGGYDHEDEDERERMEAWQRHIMDQLGIHRNEREAPLPATQSQLRHNVVHTGTENGLAFATEQPQSLVSNTKDAIGGNPPEEAVVDWSDDDFKSGFIALVGRPNSGKSTLLNYLSGTKLAIVSRKAQTTRHTIRSVINTARAQMIFIDTPGMHKPDHQLGRNMMKNVWQSFEDSDLVLLLVDAKRGNITSMEESVIQKASEFKTPIILAINKVDDMEKERLLPIIQRYSDLYDFVDIVPISAKTGDGVERLIDAVTDALPIGPRYYPTEQYTDQSERTLAAEMIREQILNYTHDEIPHGTAVKVNVFDERYEDVTDVGVTDEEVLDSRRLVRILATIYCEKDTHKGILIGKQGRTIKRIGSAARRDIERMLGCKVYLELFVKVRKDWQNKESILADLGYDPLIF
ncbi:MAG TPA: GTPase Era [Clostridiaceae bacterium]|nr:GTPase Era [Clostridiaceae bacterium]